MPEREITFAEAVREALAEEMRRDPSIFIMGEDVAEAGTPFKVLSGLVEEFGTERVMDTPISEPGFTGLGVGAAMTGMRPVIDIMFGDFLTLLYVWWQDESTDCLSYNDGRDTTFCRTTFAEFTGLGESCAWTEGSDSIHPIRCEGFTQDRNS